MRRGSLTVCIYFYFHRENERDPMFSNHVCHLMPQVHSCNANHRSPAHDRGQSSTFHAPSTRMLATMLGMLQGS